MTVSRWEKERGAYLIGHSRPNSSRRRRGELLERRARRMHRSGTGVAETSVREDVTEPLWRRLLSTDEGTGERMARLALVPLAYMTIWLVVGPAIVIAATLYGLVWRLSPRIGRLKVWPWMLAGLLLAAVGGPVLHLTSFQVITIYTGPVVDVDWLGLAAVLLWGQLSLGLLLTGGLIHSNGWAAVPANAVKKPEKDGRGEYIKTPEKERVRLDPLAGAEAPACAERQHPAKHQSFAEVWVKAPEQNDDPMTDIPDDEPLFSDEDEAWEPPEGLDEPEHEGEYR